MIIKENLMEKDMGWDLEMVRCFIVNEGRSNVLNNSEKWIIQYYEGS